MKLTRITASGIPLFKEELDLTFYARQIKKTPKCLYI